MRYEFITEYSDDEIMNILRWGSKKELEMMSLSVGEHHSNYLFAQDVCFFLLDNVDESIRANAVLGLSYIARRFRQLDTEKMKSILMKYEMPTGKNLELMECAFDDISLFLDVDIENLYNSSLE